MFRRDTLGLRKQVRIQAELQNRAAFGFARQLRVSHFIGPAAECGARLFDTLQDVRSTSPFAALQRTLTNGSRTCAHRRERVFALSVRDAITFDVNAFAVCLS